MDPAPLFYRLLFQDLLNVQNNNYLSIPYWDISRHFRFSAPLWFLLSTNRFEVPILHYFSALHCPLNPSLHPPVHYSRGCRGTLSSCHWKQGLYTTALMTRHERSEEHT